MQENECRRLTDAIEALGKDSEWPLLVAIDGPCCSGKSSLAQRLQSELGAVVLHMDDFFLRPEQRTPARYAEPGGNVDRERFLGEVLQPLTAGQPVRYSRFDCGSMTLEPSEELEPARLYVVEGTYSLHPELRQYYDLRVFITVSAAEQLARLVRREGDDAAEFVQRWIPLEELYFDKCSPEACAQLVLRG